MMVRGVAIVRLVGVQAVWLSTGGLILFYSQITQVDSSDASGRLCAK